MKSVIMALGTLAVFGALSATQLFAQIDNGVRFTTTFPFYVDNQQFPAGTYEVTRPDDNAQSMLIQNLDHSRGAFVQFIPSSTSFPPDQGRATFNEYGNQDFLSTLTVAGEDSGVVLEPGKTEKQVAASEHQHAATESVNLGSPVSGK